MRESNFAFPSQNRASVCITSALYDRRALDCTAILPLINSLTHLTYLTSTSPRIREILTMDGGLERLIRILKTTKVNDKRSGWKWTMAFQCVANVGVRGSETIRTRVVDAGMVPVIITVLDNFLKALNHVRLEKEHHHHQQQMLAAAQLLTQNTQIIQSPAPSIPMTTTSTTTTYVGNLENNAITSTNRFLPNVTTTYEIRSSDDARSDVASWGSVGDNDESSTITAGTSNATLSPSLRSTTTTTTTTHLNPANNTTTTITTITNPSNSSPSSTTSSSSSSVLEIDVLYREEDILLSLQLLAYLSKYPHIRTIFHSAYPPHNVFSLVERFTHRLHPAEIQYWAGVIMRNACRKDEARGGVRQCAYMACGKWESYAREFAKCRRCRKAKYCSKACQSKAWSEGHRWWCMERHSHADTSATTDNTNNTNNNNNSNNNNNNNNSNNSNNNNSNTNQNINNNNNNNNNGHSITFGQSTTDTNNTNGTNSTNSSSNDNNDATSLNSGSGSGSGSILVSLS